MAGIAAMEETDALNDTDLKQYLNRLKRNASEDLIAHGKLRLRENLLSTVSEQMQIEGNDWHEDVMVDKINSEAAFLRVSVQW